MIIRQRKSENHYETSIEESRDYQGGYCPIAIGYGITSEGADEECLKKYDTQVKEDLLCYLKNYRDNMCIGWNEESGEPYKKQEWGVIDDLLKQVASKYGIKDVINEKVNSTASKDEAGKGFI
jgi:hypothetical protein